MMAAVLEYGNPAQLNGLNNSPSPVSSDSLPEHEQLLYGQDDLVDDLPGADDGGGQPKRKSRRPPSTAERRATHNAVERARRESLNGRFMELAGALPNMANVKRPSKSVIVAKSLEFVQGAQSREQYLMGQNDALRQEINDLRGRLGMPTLSGSPATSMSNPLPIAHNAASNIARARKASSVSSSTGTDSPHMSTPSSLGSFDQQQQPTVPFTFNTAYASAFPSAGPPQPASPVNKEANATPTPATVAPYARPAQAPLDVNYLMALSLQQQHQQQNILNMQQHGMAGPQGYQLAPWAMAHQSAPVAAGGDAPWLFN